MLKKVIFFLVEGSGGLWRCDTSRLPSFLDTRFTHSGEITSLTLRPRFGPREIPGTHFCQSLNQPQGLVQLKVLFKLSPYAKCTEPEPMVIIAFTRNGSLYRPHLPSCPISLRSDWISSSRLWLDHPSSYFPQYLLFKALNESDKHIFL
jgi:hypothetical protein